jgi:nicotinamidase-related amidase
VTVVEDAIRGVEVSEGDSARALAEMREAGARTATSDGILASAEAR